MFKRGNIPNSTFPPDITEYERVEEALQAAERNFRNSLDNSPLGIRIIDINAGGKLFMLIRLFWTFMATAVLKSLNLYLP